MGLTPSFIYSLKIIQIVHIAIGLTQELTMYVTQKLGRGKVMTSLRLHIENKKPRTKEYLFIFNCKNSINIR